ncbi:MAG: Maf family protein [Actinomycetota bacterium]|nr:Maf family protein [Actinomycetota bacterium]
MTGEPLVLASASPRRAAILEQLGIAFEAVPAGVAEIEDADPRAAARENARRKARAVGAGHCGRTVLGADTVVDLDGRILPKPDGPGQAADWLRALSGRTHRVLGGLCLIGPDGEREALDATSVTFRELSEGDVAAYVETGEWEGKAGGYAIQGRGAALVRAIQGDYFTVVGLPVAALLDLLRSP